MASSITFVLKEPKSTKPTLIYLIFRHNSYKVDGSGKKYYSQLKYSTGMKWNPAHWNFEKRKGLNRQLFPDPTELNQRISNMENVAADIYRRLINDGAEITAETIRNELDKRKDIFPDLRRRAVNPAALKKHPITLLGFFEDYMKNLKYIYRKGQPYPVSPRTKQKYATTLTHLKAFAATKRNGLDFADIDLEFYQDFVNYLRTKVTVKATKAEPNPKIIVEMADNTVGKYISTFKTVLRAATEAGVNKNLIFQSKKFATLTEDVTNIYLTENELEVMYKLDLSASTSLERIRDVFLIGCYTCLRFSDFNNILPEQIYKSDKGTFIKLNTMKNDTEVVIPLHWIVSEILKKYKFKLPKNTTNKNFNEYIKVVGQQAGINEPVSISRIKGGVKIATTSPKFQLITTHTARRSGATNMYLSGIPAISIMKITGHKTEAVFMRYINMSAEDNANKLIDNKFYKKKRNPKAV